MKRDWKRENLKTWVMRAFKIQVWQFPKIFLQNNNGNNNFYHLIKAGSFDHRLPF